LSQAKLFSEAVGLTGITLTKLDGTAKGGVIFAVADKFQIPIRYIGVGEGSTICARSSPTTSSRRSSAAKNKSG
jgi:signal recognition particle GTPase